jgi:hypothetical protein
LLMIRHKQENGYVDPKQFSIESGTKWARKR